MPEMPALSREIGALESLFLTRPIEHDPNPQRKEVDLRLGDCLLPIGISNVHVKSRLSDDCLESEWIGLSDVISLT